MSSGPERFHVVINFKKGRITIPGAILKRLGYPEYIQLLVNPETKVIAITCSTSTDLLSHKVTRFKGECFLHSRSFVHVLGSLSDKFDYAQNYAIYGTYSSFSQCIELSLTDNEVTKRKPIKPS